MFLETLAQIDEDIFLAMHHFVRGDFMDNLMWLFSGRFIWIPMYIAIAWWITVKYGWRRAVTVAITLALAVYLADTVCAKVIRPMVERMRPANMDNPLSQYVSVVRDYRGGRFGFPSCHAANTFVLATFVAMMCRNVPTIVWMYVWALLNCFSRIYLGVHYVGDLLTGAVIGVMMGWLGWQAAMDVWPRLGAGHVQPERSRWDNPVNITGWGITAIIIFVSFFQSI